MSDQTACLFLELLPFELRLEIYELVIIHRKPHKGCHPNLLATCKQIYDETHSLLYGENEVPITMRQRGWIVGNEYAKEVELKVHTQSWSMTRNHPTREDEDINDGDTRRLASLAIVPA
ncbi:hypothetical protein LTR37_020961 [Vermiconidia calcicola]|uniref:Uncharacterized protein n=1 Tax=Vermiconidia calcicola TaxID=1690605 RepID=A0ACC3M9T4_9PEZI|nr:hypothetical protein LTR37_020961 [Vermiconidia calcicola]